MCRYRVTQADVKAVCKNWKQKLSSTDGLSRENHERAGRGLDHQPRADLPHYDLLWDSHPWMAQGGLPIPKSLNAGNNSNEGGNLVFEIICKYPVTQADAKAASSNYQNQVNLPPVG